MLISADWCRSWKLYSAGVASELAIDRGGEILTLLEGGGGVMGVAVEWNAVYVYYCSVIIS